MANLSYLLLSRCRCDMRIIPARAGFTPQPGPRAPGWRDHPRSRGVYACWARPGRTSRSGRRPVALPRSTAGLLRAAGPLLVHPRTGRPWAKGDERSWLARLLADAGLPHVTAYGLRTNLITLALIAGVLERDVMISARHTSARGLPATTASTARSSAPQARAWRPDCGYHRRRALPGRRGHERGDHDGEGRGGSSGGSGGGASGRGGRAGRPRGRGGGQGAAAVGGPGCRGRRGDGVRGGAAGRSAPRHHPCVARVTSHVVYVQFDGKCTETVHQGHREDIPMT